MIFTLKLSLNLILILLNIFDILVYLISSMTDCILNLSEYMIILFSSMSYFKVFVWFSYESLAYGFFFFSTTFSSRFVSVFTYFFLFSYCLSFSDGM